MAILRQIALDTETTGKTNDNSNITGDHRIIEIGCVEIVNRKITGREFHYKLNPDREVDEEAAKVHGMRWSDLQNEPHFRDIAAEFIDFVRGSELLIHNAKFDTSFLNSEFARMGLSETITDIASVIDTMDVARLLHPRHQVNLDNLCNLFGVNASRRVQHGALLDAQLLAEVYLAMTGGQGDLDITVDNAVSDGPRWVRQQGMRLPIMQVEPRRHAEHVYNMIGLAQGVKFSTEGEQPMAGSAWGPEYSFPYLEKGKEEGKKEYKQRLATQHDEQVARLLAPQEQEILKEVLADNQKAQKEWEDRVLGRVPKDATAVTASH